MKSQGSTVKLYCSSALSLSAIGFALYLLCFLAASDGSDYFIQGHPIPITATLITLAATLWFASALICIPKATLPTADFMRNKPCILALFPIIGSLGAALTGFSYLGFDELAALLARERKIDTTAICFAAVLLGTLLSIAHYTLRMRSSSNAVTATVATAAGPIALLTGLCGLTYFEMDHHMNAPAKVAFQLAFIATMVFLTAEVRYALDRAQPRRYLAGACIALYANVCALAGAFPALLDPEHVVHSSRILGFALLCLCNGMYIAYRLLTFRKACSTAPAPQAEQIQEKEQDDGSQQQDPMASQENN